MVWRCGVCKANNHDGQGDRLFGNKAGLVHHFRTCCHLCGHQFTSRQAYIKHCQVDTRTDFIYETNYRTLLVLGPR